MIMRKLWYVFLLLSGMFTACQAPENDGSGHLDSAESHDGFEEFYTRFHQDSLYQIQHIQFPLQGVSSNPTDHHSAFRWYRKDWRMHHLFDEQTTGFQSTFTRLGDDFVIERIDHRNGQYGMERRFSRLGDQEWFLIYYAALHPI